MNNQQREAEKRDTTKSQAPSSHYYHCYLLRSQDPKHPQKTYIGFTTNPYRRLRQHNGQLKHGGAVRTKRSGRPWEFVVIVSGFTDQISALQFEWAWQHPHKSRHVNKALKNTCTKESVNNEESKHAAKLLYQRRGVKARLNVLRILLTQCKSYQNQALLLYFFESRWKQEFMTLCHNNDTGLSSSMEWYLTNSLSTMPFWKDIHKPSTSTTMIESTSVSSTRKESTLSAQSKLQIQPLSQSFPNNHSHDCPICSKQIIPQIETPIECPNCFTLYHVRCLAKHMLEHESSQSHRKLSFQMIPKQG